ncbi:hypothetical protein PISL3812_02386 [Talaromyces islandicus]|uniref:CST complex subunit Ten1 n=1 Tax=Talaromyces islandicus TaxID=28573 RepID=A0A0U1LPS9_TALIS|nr:hypothetical protein PISL3812_02386 [Talaromyces islandicus]
MSGPPPTRLVFISQLRALPLHSKVRFLGCVTHYDVKRGRLCVEHKRRSPSSTNPTSNDDTTVLVDIYHLLDAIKADDLEVGAWLNVFGYVRSEAQANLKESLDGQIYVEATMIVNAGAIRIGEYEQTVCDMQEIDRSVARPF